MRRAEFEIKDKDEFEKLLNAASYGILCLNDKPFAYAVPVNFTYNSMSIYFHGAVLGRKYELSLKNHKGSFSIVKEHSFIPSYFSGDFACHATWFFISAFIEGELLHVSENFKKAEILDKLMSKYQNEGSYVNILSNLEKYINILNKTAVYELNIISWSLKAKMGQNMKKEQFEKIIAKLQERGSKNDILMIETMKKIYMACK
ncbi:MAG: pyridoxamine 5'-phosphate oxidase family protein [Campylobacteraceae bacterium]|jgi:nitroimidazol reductase NimA-like FMN-containing flavoprotein (pyridoxamine 5'-phosphate oxidase superfamily)|nr:pyridoxamine 5'-phosphate oxidase family protein [Campylobacteraceae bacterium]